MPLLLCFLYLFFEVLVSYEVIGMIGVLGFVLEIIVTGFLGIGILMNFRIFLSDALMRLRSRELSYEAFISSNVFRILGAILLILPGALTDIIGILMQFSVVGLLKFFMKGKRRRQDGSEIIDVEVIEKDGK